MQITHVWNRLGNNLPIQLQNDSQNAMRRRMGRPHVEDHFFALNVLLLTALHNLSARACQRFLHGSNAGRWIVKCNLLDLRGHFFTPSKV